jgi:hypothetical protein
VRETLQIGPSVTVSAMELIIVAANLFITPPFFHGLLEECYFYASPNVEIEKICET